MRVSSTSSPGFILGSIAIPIVAALLGIAYFHFWKKKPWPETLSDALTPAILSLVAVAVVECSAYVWLVADVIYTDHQSIVAKAQELQHFGDEKNQLEAQLRQARSETQHWQDAYQRLARGDTHPDRILSREETNTLYEALLRLSKDQKNKDYVRVQLGCVQDREASRLAFQLSQILREAHWNVTWKSLPQIPPGKPIPKEFEFLYSAPVGISIWTDRPNDKGMFLQWMMKDVGLDASVNPTPPPPDLKDTLIWVAYKQ